MKDVRELTTLTRPLCFDFLSRRYYETPIGRKVMPVYSFGVKSPLKFRLEDEYADSYNRAVKAFYEARKEYLETNGREWTTEDPVLVMRCSVQDLKSFIDFNAVLAEALERQHLTLSQELIQVDHLVQN